MNPQPSNSCPRRDAVLAVYLDGDVEAPECGFALVDAALLAEHLRDCADCARTLQRARRLDASLAAASGRATARAADVDGLWARAAAAMAAAPSPRPAAAARRRPWLAAAATAAAVVATAVLATLDRGTAAPAAAAAPVASAPPVDAAVAPAQTQAPVATTAIASPQPNRAATSTAVPWPWPARPPRVTEATPPAPVPPPPARVLGDEGRSDAERLAAARQLLAAIDRRDPAGDAAATLWQTFAQRPPAGGAVALWRSVLAAAREHRGLLAAVQTDLAMARRGAAQPASLAFAAQLGAAAVDAALLQALRHDPDLGPAVAAALRVPGRSDGGGALLLAGWLDLTARGLAAGDPATAAVWFAGQSPAAFAAIEARLAQTRSVPERTGCLLALAHAPESTALPTLARWAATGARDEGYAAALALAGRPLDELAALVAAAAAPDAFLLRAALGRAGQPTVVGWLGSGLSQQLRLADAEQFARLADRCRQRSAPLPH